KSNLIPSIFAGPFIGLNLSAKEKFEAPGEEYTYDFKDEIKNIEYGVTFGVGVAKKMSKMTLHSDIRFDLGLSNIAEDAEEGFSIKTKTWLFMVGISF
ncbi:MAG: PorT family protein, partial [Candidatus Saccharicenans sp.]|nr:PorT family protein [Candidatus Saccharicenans sp.]